MTNELFNMMADTSKFPLESLQELGEINTRTLNKLARLQMSFARLGIESSVQQAKLFSDAGNYEDLLSTETSLASSYSDRITELTREATEIMSETQGELVAWVEKRFEEGKKEVASAPAKPKPAAKKTSTTKSSGQKKVA